MSAAEPPLPEESPAASADAVQNKRTLAHGSYDFLVMSNRLPVDRVIVSGEDETWRRSPGGLVSALHPLMKRTSGAWIGWHGAADEELDAFDDDGIYLVPVPLSANEVSTYYEGFSNATIWPLFHDVIAPPEFHRTWWEAYIGVNQRFAEKAASIAAHGATVWVQDYQLMLVPELLRQMRPDLRIGFFLHIPFPPAELFAQLPWRKTVLEGLLGASLIGFQRESDTANFLRCVRRFTGRPVKNKTVTIANSRGPAREAKADTFPISIDVGSLEKLASDPEIIAKAEAIRASAGGRKIILGVDRLDYTKGIRHRIKAYGELLNDGSVNVDDTVLIQVASPSRERVGSYVQLREDVELAVGRINGNFDTLEHTAIRYLHHSYPAEQMAALYLAADIMLVTALRDGMNLVAKEYVAARLDETGVLVLSEFAGAADDLRAAVLTNPHDIHGMKKDILKALSMPEQEMKTRMRKMRKQVAANDIDLWSRSFLERLEQAQPVVDAAAEPLVDATDILPLTSATGLALEGGLRNQVIDHAAAQHPLLIALDFDGVVAPIVSRAEDARPLPETAEAIAELAELEGVQLAFVSGRSLASLRSVASPPANVALIGSHGAEHHIPGALEPFSLELSNQQLSTLAQAEKALRAVASRYQGAWVEKKPAGVVLHVRQVLPDLAEVASQEGIAAVSAAAPLAHVSRGKAVVEVAVLSAHKGQGLELLRAQYAPHSVMFFGDDVTDENGFKALNQGEQREDIGVKVGPGSTAAGYRLQNPQDVALFLGSVLKRLKRNH